MINLLDFLREFKDDKSCEDFLISKIHKDGKVCPHCKGESYKINEKKENKRYNYQWFKCKQCNKRFTILTNTVFHGSKLSLQKWFLCIHFLSTTSKGISSIQLSKQVGITKKTAWQILTKLRKLSESEIGIFSGTVEADETFVGGKEKNKHIDKKGTIKKEVVVGVLNRETRKVKACHVTDTKAITLQGYIEKNVKEGSTLYTGVVANIERVCFYDLLEKFFECQFQPTRETILYKSKDFSFSPKHCSIRQKTLLLQQLY